MSDENMTPTAETATAPEPIRRPRRRIRDWRERWDDNAPMAFTRRMRIGTTKAPFVPAGTKLTPAMRKRFGLARLKRWWKVGLLTRTDAAKRTRRGNPTS